MKKLVNFKWLGSAVLLLAVAFMPATLAVEPAAELKTLQQGKVVVQQIAPRTKEDAPAVEARILIDKPPEKVWNVVIDPEKLMAEEPKVKKVKVISKQNNRLDVEFNVLMTKLFPMFSYVLRQEIRKPYEMSFRRLSGSFKDFEGSWRVTPAENGQKSILSYRLQLDPGPMIPQSMLMMAVKADLPVMMRNVRKAVDKYAVPGRL